MQDHLLYETLGNKKLDRRFVEYFGIFGYVIYMWLRHFSSWEGSVMTSNFFGEWPQVVPLWWLAAIFRCMSDQKERHSQVPTQPLTLLLPSIGQFVLSGPFYEMAAMKWYWLQIVLYQYLFATICRFVHLRTPGDPSRVPYQKNKPKCIGSHSFSTIFSYKWAKSTSA